MLNSAVVPERVLFDKSTVLFVRVAVSLMLGTFTEAFVISVPSTTQFPSTLNVVVPAQLIPSYTLSVSAPEPCCTDRATLVESVSISIGVDKS